MELLANGKRILSHPNILHVPTAVSELGAATEAFSELYGEGAVECAEVSRYCSYACPFYLPFILYLFLFVTISLRF